jgi:hypothetical protein
MNTCIVCLEPESPTKLIELKHCGVYYIHKSCHKKWLLTNTTCIICRQSLTCSVNIYIQLNTYYFILFKISYIITILGCFSICIYIFVTCDFNSPYCKLF